LVPVVPQLANVAERTVTELRGVLVAGDFEWLAASQSDPPTTTLRWILRRTH
jgi:hypothetical protein